MDKHIQEWWMCPLKWNQIPLSHMAGLRIFCQSKSRKVTDIAPTWFRSRTHQHSDYSRAFMCFHSQQIWPWLAVLKNLYIHRHFTHRATSSYHPSHMQWSARLKTPKHSRIHTSQCSSWGFLPLHSGRWFKHQAHHAKWSFENATPLNWVYTYREICPSISADLIRSCFRLVQLTPRCQMWSWITQPILNTLQNGNFLKHLPAQDPRVELPATAIPHILLLHV